MCYTHGVFPGNHPSSWKLVPISSLYDSILVVIYLWQWITSISKEVATRGVL